MPADVDVVCVIVAGLVDALRHDGRLGGSNAEAGCGAATLCMGRIPPVAEATEGGSTSTEPPPGTASEEPCPKKVVVVIVIVVVCSNFGGRMRNFCL